MDIKDCLFIDMKGSTSYKSIMELGGDVADPYKYKSRLFYRIRYFCNFLKFEPIHFIYEVDDYIKKKNPQLIVISGSLIFEPFLKKLRNNFPDTPIRYYYTNVVREKASIKPNVLTKYNINGYSWDINDCKKYSFHYAKPVFNVNILPKSNDLIYDACFIGADKGRYKTVKYIKDELEKCGKNCFVLITPDYNFLKFLRPYYSDRISYQQYLEVVSKSKCIIDLVQNGQVGTTMRVMEAVFSHKKIITNNYNLVNYDFYKKNNIFIIGKDDLSNLKSFIESEYEPVDESVLEEYKLTNFINELLAG